MSVSETHAKPLSGARMTRLALGTTQFGMPYGIANRQGQVDSGALAEILGVARSAGLNTLDTALAYGNSQQRLGEAGVTGWQIVTKLPQAPSATTDIEGWVQAQCQAALAQLRQPRLYGLLLHHPDQLLSSLGPGLYRALQALKTTGLICNIGISVYTPEDLMDTLNKYAVDLVQMPLNVLVRRFKHTNTLTRLHQAGIEVHVRSVFLQGLLLMTELPARFAPWRPLWKTWRHWLHDTGQTPLQACLGFVLDQPEPARIVVGVDSRQQLEQLLAAAGSVPAVTAPASLYCHAPQLIDPRTWKE